MTCLALEGGVCKNGSEWDLPILHSGQPAVQTLCFILYAEFLHIARITRTSLWAKRLCQRSIVYSLILVSGSFLVPGATSLLNASGI